MKFSAVHKLASYLMVVSAFLALALSGELPLFAALLGGAGILGSWFWEAPRVRPERWTVWWNALAVAAFGWTILAALSGGDWLIAGTDFVVFLLVAKLFNRRSSRDYLWVYVLTFVMLVAGTALNADFSYALCFLGYVVFATWALILFHLRREMEDNFLLKHSNDSSSERVEVERILSSRRIVGFPFLAATSAVSLGIFFLSAALFLLFPRIGLGFFFQRGHNRMTFAGFSDGVSLGGHGVIRSDPTVVMRVQVSDPDFGGAMAPELHWRAVAFDRYSVDRDSRGHWERSPRSFGTDARTSVTPTRTRVSLSGARKFGDLSRALRQEIFLEPLDTSALFAASRPLAFDLEHVPINAAGNVGRFGQNDEVRYTHFAGLRYVAYSDPTPPSPATLAAAGDADRRAYAAYLQIPPEITPRVRELAERITAGRKGPYAKAEAVLLYLKGSYRYTNVMQSPGLREPLDDFLFERRAGHCEYFSSAMAILLRVVGVPTRNVDGFLGGEWNEYGRYIAVRGGDAHSWVEVWFDGVGWVTYDPTPSSIDVALARGGGGALDRLRRMLDTLRLQWFKWVMEYDLSRQLGLMKALGGLLGIGEDGLDTKALGRFVKAHRTAIGLTLVGIVAAVAAPIAWRRRRRKLAETPAFARRPDHPLVTLYARVGRALAHRGFARPDSQTPREHARALAEKGAPGAEDFAELTEAYYTVRYAPPPVAAAVDLAAARALAARVRQALRAAQ
jgi:protein-glutamine gamma-glutamyltransferase